MQSRRAGQRRGCTRCLQRPPSASLRAAGCMASSRRVRQAGWGCTVRRPASRATTGWVARRPTTARAWLSSTQRVASARVRLGQPGPRAPWRAPMPMPSSTRALWAMAVTARAARSATHGGRRLWTTTRARAPAPPASRGSGVTSTPMTARPRRVRTMPAVSTSKPRASSVCAPLGFRECCVRPTTTTALPHYVSTAARASTAWRLRHAAVHPARKVCAASDTAPTAGTAWGVRALARAPTEASATQRRARVRVLRDGQASTARQVQQAARGGWSWQPQCPCRSSAWSSSSSSHTFWCSGISAARQRLPCPSDAPLLWRAEPPVLRPIPTAPRRTRTSPPAMPHLRPGTPRYNKIAPGIHHRTTSTHQKHPCEGSG
eukprot:m.11291 g.11291  ORF g.11291 m.11291 type:complete len:376 (+) comp8432_c0_seq1:3385-4512(+)